MPVPSYYQILIVIWMEYYTECVAGDRSNSDLPWSSSRQCSEFSVSLDQSFIHHKHKIFLPPQSSSPCDFGPPPGINIEQTSGMVPSGQRSGYYMVNPGSSFITASLAIEVEDVSLFYAALGGDIPVVSVVSNVCTIII